MWRIDPNNIDHYVSFYFTRESYISMEHNSHLKREKSQVKEKRKEKVFPPQQKVYIGVFVVVKLFIVGS